LTKPKRKSRKFAISSIPTAMLTTFPGQPGWPK
jgi:hypothetical protein